MHRCIAARFAQAPAPPVMRLSMNERSPETAFASGDCKIVRRNRLGVPGLDRKVASLPASRLDAMPCVYPSTHPRAERDLCPPGCHPGHRSLQRRPYPGMMGGSVGDAVGRGRRWRDWGWSESTSPLRGGVGVGVSSPPPASSLWGPRHPHPRSLPSRGRVSTWGVVVTRRVFDLREWRGGLVEFAR